MKFSRISAVSLGLVLVASAAGVNSSTVHALIPLPVDASVSVDTKARMQANLASTSGAQVDGRIYKGGEKEGAQKNNPQSRGLASASSSQANPSDDKMKVDKNETQIESDGDSVNISYKVRGKFLGFIPMGMFVRTSIGSAGEVKVSHPWYSFLVSSSDDSIQTDVMSDIEDIKTEFGVTAGAKIATSSRSDFIKAVHDILKSAFDMSASTTSR